MCSRKMMFFLKKVHQMFGGLEIMPYLCTRKQGTTPCNTGKSCTACSLGTPPGLDRSKGTWL